MGSAEPTADSTAGIDNVAALMKQHPNTRVRVEGNAYSPNDPDAGKRLGSLRAQTVKKMLVDQGIEPGRIDVLGKQGRAENAATAGEGNRRVDLVVLSH
jgi:outer membrane protein OmpA-like peptidoglycan-associated protein